MGALVLVLLAVVSGLYYMIVTPVDPNQANKNLMNEGGDHEKVPLEAPQFVKVIKD